MISTKNTLVFFISSFSGINTGIGGHYRSVKEISKSLQSGREVFVITFGDVPSSVFDDVSYHRHIQMDSPFDIKGLKALAGAEKEIVHQSASKPIFISVGWVFSSVPMMLAARGLDVLFAHIKPGGGSPKWTKIFQEVPLVVFHDEDRKLFSNNGTKQDILVAPGRVTPPPRDEEYLEKAVYPHIHDKIGVQTLVCVMRISEEKRKPLDLIYQSICSHPHDFFFFHYGVSQDKPMLDELKNKAFGAAVKIIDDDYSVNSAARALHGFGAFCGIGRSAIEAMALGLPTFVPVAGPSGTATLVAITEENWRVFLNQNFTHRAKYEDLARAGACIEVDGLADPKTREKLAKDAFSVYSKNLSPEASRQAWENFLDSIETRPGVGFLRTLYYVLKGIKLTIKRVKLSQMRRSQVG